MNKPCKLHGRTAKLWLSVQFLPDQNWSITRKINTTDPPTNEPTNSPTFQLFHQNKKILNQPKQNKRNLQHWHIFSTLHERNGSQLHPLWTCRAPAALRLADPRPPVGGHSWVGLHDADGEMFLSTRISRFIRLHYVHIDTAHIRSI